MLTSAAKRLCLSPFIRRHLYLRQKTTYTRYTFKMLQAHVWHENGSDTFRLSFQYNEPELRVNRQFNFARQISETVDSVSNRISVNVGKILAKWSKKKRQGKAATPPGEVKVEFFLAGAKLSADTTWQSLFERPEPLSLCLNNASYEIIKNPPWVSTLALPNSMLAGFPTYPSKFEHTFLDKSLTRFSWSKSADLKVWIQVGSGYLFTPQNTEIGSFLKVECLPKNERHEGPIVETISKVQVEPGPGECPFESRHAFTRQKLQDKEFRIVSYNILADLYCDSDFTRTNLFPYCPPYALALDYRKQLMLKEVIGYNSDVICLQEVDEKVYEYDLKPALCTVGYESVFNKKGGKVSEGLAVFYNKSRFSCLDSTFYVLGEQIGTNPLFADLKMQLETNQKLYDRICVRTTSLQTATLQSLDDEKSVLLVANTHLYFHPNADHIRLLQSYISIRLIENLSEKLKTQHPGKTVAVVFCGDFNTDPACGIYKLYTKGTVPPDCVDWKSCPEEEISGFELKQLLPLASACGTPKYTNYTPNFKECIDYIFHDRSALGVVQVVPFPSEEELSANIGMPSVVFPSDHLALVADLKWLS